MVSSKTERGRFPSHQKMDVVLRVLHGDDLDVVSGEVAGPVCGQWTGRVEEPRC